MEKNRQKSSNYIHYRKPENNSVSADDIYIRKSKKEKELELSSDTMEPIYFLGDRIYSCCKLKDCFPSYKMDLKGRSSNLQFLGINFQMGKIVDSTLKINKIGPRRPNFSRVRFTLKIPISIRLRNIESGEIFVMNGYLPEIEKDLVLFIPEARNEFNFKIIADTRCDLIAPPVINEGTIELPTGVYSMISVVGKIHMLMPVYSHMPEPPEGEDFRELEEVTFKEFIEKPFPDDFFPSKFDDPDL